MLILLLTITGCSTEKTSSQSEEEVTSDKTEKEEKASNSNDSAEQVTFDEEYGTVKNPDSVLEDITVEVYVDRVIDGDTIEITNENGKKETVNLLLIDAPETDDSQEGVQEFGEKAYEFMQWRLESSRVQLERVNPETDKDGITLGHVWLSNGPNNFIISELILKEGLARVVNDESNTKYLQDFKAWEQEAKDEKLNIWKVDGYVTDNGFDMSVIQ